ncbi:hypothetical protein SteCoe_31694 [Stentor coeruleus]|uniref:CCT domain-containing protein n=1 Tax=Stentor coeruleus TaxID=5963 RepID=A0A1R2B155_9CILI|nr:hypothetical protein SteCoe_31694 [Stentor coeruleus]
MHMPGLDDELSMYIAYQDYQSDEFIFPNRKNSFIDLLSTPISIPEDNLIQLQIDFMQEDMKLPEISTQPSESEIHELNLDELFEIQSTKKKHDNNAKIPLMHSMEKNDVQIVGTLTLKQRKEKIAKYLEKRKKRNWHKKIYYDCRKKVADNRLRVKGRFVKREQAILKLGSDHEAIKHLL